MLSISLLSWLASPLLAHLCQVDISFTNFYIQTDIFKPQMKIKPLPNDMLTIALWSDVNLKKFIFRLSSTLTFTYFNYVWFVSALHSSVLTVSRLDSWKYSLITYYISCKCRNCLFFFFMFTKFNLSLFDFLIQNMILMT